MEKMDWKLKRGTSNFQIASSSADLKVNPRAVKILAQLPDFARKDLSDAVKLADMKTTEALSKLRTWA